ncbi:MATE family efflux transporter [uncultured Sneathiella sp.]|jgi:putative MATE family efflux protein|uniref:MATE family efflux transporter n=1 Tax=uncultured Sneathiella sp. TaxID=879315 RepID=UPI002591B9F1|nr:MATE family efflux transporter [uncultured Sneathiella sp.]
MTTETSSPAVAASPNALLTAPILGTLARLSVPNILAMSAAAVVAIAETAYAGQLGISALAGLALVFPMVMLQQMMSAGAMGGGVSSAISRALGANDDRRAEQLAFHAVIIGAMAGLLFGVFFLLCGEYVYRLLGGNGVVITEALAYSNIVFLGATGLWLTNTLASIIRGSGDMKTPSITLLAVALSQFLLAGTFGLGWGPFPALGMAGIGLGLVIAFSVSTLFLLWYLVSGRARVKLTLRGIKLKKEMFQDILKVGAISCISPLQTVLTVLILTRLISEFGVEALAGYGIGARLEFLLVPIAFAIGVACVPMVGMAIGANNVARARKVAWTGGICAGILIGSIGFLVALFPDIWTGMFTDVQPVMKSAGLYFAWVGPFYGLFGLGLCLYFSSQGAGKVLGPVIAGTIRLVVVALGGWILATNAMPEWTIFALIGGAMAIYGAATALAVYVVRW